MGSDMNTKVVYVKDLTPPEQIIVLQGLKAAIEMERNKLEPMPEFVAPPPLIPLGDTELRIIYPWFYLASIYFILGLVVGVVGCLYATSYLP